MQFLRSLGLNVGASGIGIAIGVLTTPLMTRIFPPAAYGQNGLIVSLISLMATLGLLGLPIAMAREQSGPEQPRLLRASVVGAAVLVCVVLVATLLIVNTTLPSRYGLTDAVVLMLPPMIAVYAFHLIGTALAVANGAFTPLAAARVTDAAGARFGTLGLGFSAFPGVSMMIAGDMAGKIGSISMLLRSKNLRNACRAAFGRISVSELAATLAEYKQFAVFANIAQAMPVAMAFILNWHVAHTVGIEQAGQFVLANSILSLAVTAIGLGSTPVVFHELAKTADENPHLLNRLILKLMAAFSGLGALSMLPVIVFGPSLFGFVFGTPWQTAGEVAQWLAGPFVLAFSLTVLMPVFRVVRRIRSWFWVQLVGFTGFSMALLFFAKGEQLHELAPQLALILLFNNIAMLVGILAILRTSRSMPTP